MSTATNRNNQALPGIAVLMVMLIGLPLVGIVLSGGSVAAYLKFPPLTIITSHAAFSFPAFVGLAVIGVLVIAAIGIPLIRAWRITESMSPVSRFPWFGWAGLAACIIAWVVAWTRFDWFSSIQLHTFTPLWVAYIFVINGMTFRRTGRCLMTANTRYFLLLFPLSAGFWWFFEYLNRFVSNWYYVGGVSDMSAAQYILFATIPFSTVLPAVLSTQEWLQSFPTFSRAFGRAPTLGAGASRPVGAALLALSGAGLMCIGIWPDYLFPLVWVSPLLVVLGVQVLFGSRTLLDELAAGRWTGLVTGALAALICGFFWELWNTYSQAKWIYSIPFVHAAKVFEMPVLGYMGYLPFGIQCLLVGEMAAQNLGRYDERVAETAGSDALAEGSLKHV
jgi:hypothetical protein